MFVLITCGVCVLFAGTPEAPHNVSAKWQDARKILKCGTHWSSAADAWNTFAQAYPKKEQTVNHESLLFLKLVPKEY